MTIAISAATGQLGRLALAALKARGATAIALARNPARAADLGVPVRAFDYAAPDVAALRGVSTLGSRLIDRQSQNMTVAARATADRKVLAHLS
jgi:NAD(P)H dehydrogenase (quinone)